MLPFHVQQGRLDLGRLADSPRLQKQEAGSFLHQQIKQEKHCDSYQRKSLANIEKIVWRKLMNPQLEFCIGV